MLEAGKTIHLSGLWGAAKACQALHLCRESGQSAWVVTKGPKEQEAFLDDLRALGGVEAMSFPAWEVMPHEETPPQKEIVAERFDTLRRLALWREKKDKKPVVVVTTVAAAAQKVFSPARFARERFAIRRDMPLPKNKLTEELVRLGYELFPMVGTRGEYSLRGGIVDFFPLNREHPLRVEFFGNEIESIREFDAGTQRTVAELGGEEIEIPRAEEKEGVLDCPAGDLALLTEHGGDGIVLILDEAAELEEKARSVEGLMPEKGRLFAGWNEFLRREKRLARVELSILPRESATPEEKELNLDSRSLESALPAAFGLKLESLDLARARTDAILNAVAGWLREGQAVTIFCHNAGERDRLLELLREKDAQPPPEIKLGRLSGGFILEKEKKIFLSDAEIFGRYKVRRSRWKFTGSWLEAPAEAPAMDLEEGDFVVHVNYGIGRYRGVAKIPVEGAPREMLEIEYAGEAKLYVPLPEAHLVERYVGFAEKGPELDVLGGARWRATKLKVERAIQDYAADLLRLQAERSVLKGHAFSADKPWQREFEDSFLHEETADQLRAIEAVKSDMQNPRPMDRLLCGDVGYGKTEVAVRAAFKAAIDGKQVAVLVPTTVLAQQHGRTFAERLADYPVRVETLSRFKSKTEQKKIIEAVKRGEVDIVIGTHRLIQPDVEFKDLGLVVIDEEQRFGVRHKERLKKLRRLVDVLTMTATPIPRTLYLSLIGAKEMSAIQTPPVDRLPIETHLLEWDDKTIREAILREMNREGQVFFVHNRVQTIERVKERLQKLVPEAKMEIAHGQMGEGELESVMQAFVEGKLDVLVCTTIIESGLDIPNANTILVDRADRFGLAELYQLRGRVGRFKHQAYAYLLLPKDKVIVAEAKKRLKALMEFSSLGAGFKVAMKDLEIRGAGNILGEEQSGHIAAIGFDLYCRLLKKTVQRLKGAAEPERPSKDSLIHIGVEGELPAAYIPDLAQRLEIYKEIGEAASQADLDEIGRGLRDRFGPPPPEAQRLLGLAGLKRLASAKNVDSVELKEGKLFVRRGAELVSREGRLPRVVEGPPEQVLEAVKKVLSGLE